MATSRQQTACDRCRRMKIKCEKQGASCAYCLVSRTSCTFPSFDKKPAKMKRPAQLTSMEERIERMESILTATGLDSQTDPLEAASRDASSRGTTHDLLADKLATLVVNEEGDGKFIGSASPFSLLSPHGIQWITECIGSQDLKHAMAGIANSDWATWRAFDPIFYRSIPLQEREPCPDKALAQQYVDSFFQYGNSVYPLYDREVVDLYVEKQYSKTPPVDVAWYASFYAIMAVGSMAQAVRTHGSQRVMRVISPHHPNFRQSWKFFRNANSTFIELNYKHTNIMAAQAMLAMALLTQALPDPQSTYTLIASACQIIQRLGLHSLLEQDSLSTSISQRRRNVFWVAFVLDKGACLRSGCPPNLHQEDVGVPLPDTDPSHLFFRDDHEGRFSLFRGWAELSLIEGRVYTNLFSARARQRHKGNRISIIAQLDSQLETWKSSVPEQIRPGNKIDCDQTQIMPIMLFHLAYFDCLQTLHRALPSHSSWFGERSSPSFAKEDPPATHNTRVVSSTAICVEAARHSINLFLHLMGRHAAPSECMNWMAAYYPLASVLVLFAYVVQKPEDPCAESDVVRMCQTVNFLSKYMTFDWSQSVAASRTSLIFQRLCQVAKEHVARAKPQPGGQVNRRSDQSFSLPTDFATAISSEELPLQANVERKDTGQESCDLAATWPDLKANAPEEISSLLAAVKPLERERELKTTSRSRPGDQSSRLNERGTFGEVSAFMGAESDPTTYDSAEWDLFNFQEGYS